MLYHSVMEEANYAQLMTTLESVCDLSLESYRSSITDDTPTALILESSAKSGQTLITFIKNAIKTIVDHITDAVNSVRVKLQKKKLDKIMSPEMKKVIEQIASGKKIMSADGVKIKAKVEDAKKYVNTWVSKVDGICGKLVSNSSGKYKKQLDILCDECESYLKKNLEELKVLSHEKKQLTGHDIYRFVDAGMDSLKDVESLAKSVKSLERSLTTAVNKTLTKVDKLKKLTEAVYDDDEAEDAARQIGSKVSSDTAVQSAVNKAVRTAKYVGSYSSEVSRFSFGFVNALVSDELMDMATQNIATSLTRGALLGTWKPGIGAPLAIANVTKIGYLKKKLTDDKRRYDRKAAQDRHMREEMRNERKQMKNPDLKLMK